MKQCSHCKEEKKEEEFQRNRSTKDGLQDQCTPCRKETDRRSYLRRSPEQKARYLARDRDTARQNLRLLYEYLLAHPCVDCGESDTIVLEFDHVRGEKKHNVADVIRSGRKWQTIIKEIEKCEVRCANCHRRATAKRGGNWSKHIWSLGNNTPT
jgi:hypothetical protein